MTDAQLKVSACFARYLQKYFRNGANIEYKITEKLTGVILTQKFKKIGLGNETQISKWIEKFPGFSVIEAKRLFQHVDMMPTFTDYFRLMFEVEIGIRIMQETETPLQKDEKVVKEREKENRRIENCLALLTTMLGSAGSQYVKKLDENITLGGLKDKRSKRKLKPSDLPHSLQKNYFENAKRYGTEWIDQSLIDAVILEIYSSITSENKLDSESRKNRFLKKDIFSDISQYIEAHLSETFSVSVSVTARHVAEVISRNKTQPDEPVA